MYRMDDSGKLLGPTAISYWKTAIAGAGIGTFNMHWKGTEIRDGSQCAQQLICQCFFASADCVH